MTALVLVAHGARDPAWAVPLQSIRNRIDDMSEGVTVRIAFLELQPPSLGEALAELASAGHRQVNVAPILWSAGGRHMRTDIPEAIAGFQASHPDVGVHCLLSTSDAADE